MILNEQSKKVIKMIKKSILIWLSMIPLAILNGILRDIVIAPLIGMEFALPASGITLCLLIFTGSLIFIPRLGKGKPKVYWNIGFLWVLLTIVFEFILGLSIGDTFSELLKAYDITTGNLWLIVVIFVGIAPWLVAKLKQII